MVTLLLMGILIQDTAVIQTAQVDYVILDVSALEEDGGAVTDLGPDDFEIKEGRKKMSVSYFEVLDFKSPPAPVTTTEVAIDPIEQTLILVLDLAVMPRPQIDEALGRVEDFLRELPTDRPIHTFLFSLDIGVISKSFTDPHTAADDLVVFEARLHEQLEQSGDLRGELGLGQLEQEFSGCFPKSGSSEMLQSSKSGGAGMIAPCLENAFRIHVKKQEARSRQVMATLGKLIGFLARAPGLKSVYLVSPGFSSDPGQSAVTMAQAYANLINDRMATNSPGVAPSPVGSGNPGRDRGGVFTAAHFQLSEVSAFSPASLDDEYRQLTHLALANRVVIYSFGMDTDPRSSRGRTDLGNQSAQDVKSERIYFNYVRELGSGLSRLAEITGGEHRKVTHLSQDLAKAVNKNRFYYVLGYDKPQKGGKKFRNIKVKCKRPGITLKYRNGYYPMTK